MLVAVLDVYGELVLYVYEEIGRGVFEDKVIKNLFVCEYVVNNMCYIKIVGVIEEDDVIGLIFIVELVGVVCGIILIINLILIVIFKVLILLKICNLIVFVFYLLV